jgi:hypothetical protein
VVHFLISSNLKELTGHADSINGGGGLNETALPLRKTEWGTCVPVYPHNWIKVHLFFVSQSRYNAKILLVKVNTVFEVARQNGLQTAYGKVLLQYPMQKADEF